MTRDARHARTARLKTAATCVLLEALALVLMRPFTAGYGEAAFMSALTLGPLSLWVAPRLYRQLSRAKCDASPAER
ncbi:hypothetical protein [Pelomonas cellulosilytica]|uniref:Uncharacterized protein n=1 Tax=Pelomonas cellulosilytica TaxID=2906762 RepID=A0ABS8XUP3_9BURK|nr:hypothetical protein [Pelomonas sp. P8]MCE4554607.1 hypothetical protein [Pelomonas sp. P8]